MPCENGGGSLLSDTALEYCTVVIFVNFNCSGPSSWDIATAVSIDKQRFGFEFMRRNLKMRFLIYENTLNQKHIRG
jgi:hypothetical protein